MKIGLYTDIHWSEYSSIIRSNSDKYSTRLSYLIKSMNWAEETFIKEKCDLIICLGDFFDRPDLNCREITALNDIIWNKIPHKFLIGNHEADSSSLSYNSTEVLKNNGFDIISKPELLETYVSDILFIPYFIEDNRETLKSYCDKFFKNKNRRKIIFSHNDIKGIQYGIFESKQGFDISEIEQNCDLFINGHLHNGSKFCKNGINLGNLSGQNFSEDALRYNHSIFILDTNELILDEFENPYAFNFYKLDITENQDIEKLNQLKDNSVITITCNDSNIDRIKNKLLLLQDKIIESRIIIKKSNEINNNNETKQIDLTIDHILKFMEFAREKIGNSDILEYELSKIYTN